MAASTTTPYSSLPYQAHLHNFFLAYYQPSYVPQPRTDIRQLQMLLRHLHTVGHRHSPAQLTSPRTNLRGGKIVYTYGCSIHHYACNVLPLHSVLFGLK